MAATRTFEFLLSAKTEGWQKITTAKKGLTAFNRELTSSSSIMASATRAVAGLVGAYAGMEALSKTAEILLSADTAAFQLESSLKSATREFEDIGSIQEWNSALAAMGDELKVYSGTDLKEAASRTVDMTKRLGLEASQMQEVIKRSADLAAGKTTLVDAVERVTAALRGEAEASEFLGLTLNETYVKNWYEASGAMQGAWKDLTDMQKAQIRYNILLEQSDGVSGKAKESIKTLSGAWMFLSTQINNAVADNKDLAKAISDIAALVGNNAEAVGDFAADMIKAAAATARFVVDNKEAILTAGEWAGKLIILVAAAKLVLTPLAAINAAVLAMTGANLVGWLSATLAGVKALGAGVVLVAGPWAALLTAILASGAAVAKLISVYRELKQVEAENAAQQVYNNGLNDKLLSKVQAIGTATGVNIRTLADWQKAIKDHTIVYDQAAGKWVAAHDKVTAAGKKSATAVKEATGDALKDMEAKYRSYVQAVKGYQDQIAQYQMTSAEKLRDMSRSTMDDTSAWYDMKKEAEEYAAVADTAAAAGDWEKAKTYSDKAAAAYAKLNTEVTENGRVTVSAEQAQQTAMAGYEENTNGAIAALKEMQTEAATAADKLIEAAGFADLSKGLTDLEKEWFTSWKEMHSETKTQLAKVEEEIQKIVSKTRTVYINVKTVESKATGGLVGVQRLAAGGGVRNMLGGGWLPGYGGGDRRRILGEDGEYMINKGAVKEAGTSAAHAFNTKNWGALMGILSTRFGNVIHRATGGEINSVASYSPVGSAATAGAGAVYSTPVNITINAGGSIDTLTRSKIRQLTDAISTEIDRRTRRSSK
ncbi:MAG: hypothetical protein WC340_10420 [Kiritimatiellia bacterium]